MCDTCGCGLPGEQVRILKPGEDQDTLPHIHLHTLTHEHSHTHSGQEHSHVHVHGGRDDNEHPLSAGHDHHTGHSHDQDHLHSHVQDHLSEGSRIINVEQDALGRNQLLAERNRGYFDALQILALNLVSSPGSGKTSLIERTIREMKGRLSLCIIEGDQQTMNDAGRIHAAGAPVVQVNTGQGCHLDADMVGRALKVLDPPSDALLIIENVGNLVCPALFDLGESKRVVIMSVTEGEDKPVKYPYMFKSSGLCIINKTDLLPYLDYDLGKALEYVRMVNPDMKIIELSVRTGEGMELWYDWLRQEKAGL